MSRRRPGGIVAFAAFFAFGTVMAGSTCVALLFPDSPATQLWRLNPDARQALEPTRLWSAALMLVVATACAASAVGLWRRTSWGRRLAIAVLGINVLGDVGNAIIRGDRRTLIGVPIAATMIGYLLRPATRRNFAPGDRNDLGV